MSEKTGCCSSRRIVCRSVILLSTARRARKFPLFAFAFFENQASGSIPGYHCWAEFYLNGLGWIPIDASEAWKNAKKHDYFFGAKDVNRVMFSAGRDIPVTPSPAAGPLNFIVYPYVEIDGKPFTAYDKSFSFTDSAKPTS